MIKKMMMARHVTCDTDRHQQGGQLDSQALWHHSLTRRGNREGSIERNTNKEAFNISIAMSDSLASAGLTKLSPCFFSRNYMYERKGEDEHEFRLRCVHSLIRDKPHQRHVREVDGSTSC